MNQRWAIGDTGNTQEGERTMTYYVRTARAEGAFQDIPERATLDDIIWFCGQYDYDFENMLDKCFEVDTRSDEEVLRDRVRPVKDRVLEANNYMATHTDWEDAEYDVLEQILGIETATAKELFDLEDYAELWFKTKYLECIENRNAELAKEMRYREFAIEDILYEAIDERVGQEV